MATFTYALDAPMPASCQGGAVSIGNFDGVHLGHQALLAETRRQAQTLGVPAIAVTFDPHPSQILRPERTGPFLSTIEDRTALLHQYGVEHVLFLQTTAALLQLSAREFFDRIILEQLGAKALVEGFNFGFGRNREGTNELLRTWCQEKNIAVTLLPPQEVLGQPVSSSRVRAELLLGNVDVVQQLLGRPYRIAGIVGTGARRGATLGFPTANLQQIATLVPGNGVYAVRAILGSKPYPAAANVGPNPTFGENARKVEVHLIGFNGQLYDKHLAVDFTKKIRETKTFASANELTAQIQMDVAEVRNILGVQYRSEQ